MLRVILSRAARSARRAAHYDLEAPSEPMTGPYWCHKHRRTCRPVESANGFLRRYALDTLTRIEAFAAVAERPRGARAPCDACDVEYDETFDGVITSPPYPGLIDYHEQHRYAYELLGLEKRSDLEIGAGTTKGALEAYSEGIARALANAASALAPDAPVLIVVNDRRDLYPGILERAGPPRSRSASGVTSTGERAGAPVSTTRTSSSRASSLAA